MTSKADPTPTDLRRQTPGAGRTEQSREQGAEPRLPHERDESSDSQDTQRPVPAEPSGKELGEKAFDDLDSGRQDTGRLPVTDEVYEELRKEPGAKQESAPRPDAVEPQRRGR
ncbi:MAG: hypothetical protein H0W40_06080 [Methylibium sp.]|uniref:hypothetical protein n=1 Tax=Methylibium sp. TaxID=2067992 RepID=UPI0017D3A2BE|nr:hypothetical protein [Methylibium sp.]MBA3596930.1 hypothetical protein [Methylibium sp.]